MVSVTFQFIAGPRHVTELEAKCSVETIVRTVEQAFGAATSAGVRIVLRGEALPVDRPHHVVVLREGGE
ncbi:hypothetical protein TSOC_000320 [Tetrabaena socialis]|uniref:Uncharacterized protein n=1 Tax=Tetrabaena socialis TaxID=47790 RepID=A0A2J8AJT7_9CHLO|nr:hypothetical protein TSOC_000320 [Tetrabaena socialis]|eukprot:PNH12784.1 hypothetical protein TSOC_000320 [Tetrabaena socialis]